MSPDFVIFLRDANGFVIASQEAIETSIPHIYLSALPFTRPSSTIMSHFLPSFYSLPQIQINGIARDREPALVLRGHSGSVLCVASSLDGTRIASGSSDNTICVWDSQTGALAMRPLQGHTGVVVSVCFSPDGMRIVSGSLDRTIRVWDVQTGEQAMQPLEGHTNGVNSVAFSPDGTRIVSGSNDNTIRVWDAQTGKPATE
jgi:WD40 repeat protein